MNKASKISRKISSMVVVATLCTSGAGWLAAAPQDNPNNPAASQGMNENQTQQKTESTTSSTSTEVQPQKMNKCSKLIGTAVENPAGDKLGKIDEVVVDFDNGRVAYCVLDVEHGILGSAKYLAVPLAALQPSADGARLILNADKDKVAAAQGFDRENWPSVANPSWGAQPFWQTTPKANITSPPAPDQRNLPSGTSR
jgi:sporulation protein YlmC with PRC-barrel domain